jgi:hypothetical protein
MLPPFLVPLLAQRRRPVLVGLLLVLDVTCWLDLGNITTFPPGRLTPLLLCALAGWWLWESRHAAAVVVGLPGASGGAVLAA